MRQGEGGQGDAVRLQEMAEAPDAAVDAFSGGLFGDAHRRADRLVRFALHEAEKDGIACSATAREAMAASRMGLTSSHVAC